MNSLESKEHLDTKAILTLLVLTLMWGLNFSLIRYVNQGVSPVFASALRSLVASICGVIYCLRKGERLFHTDIRLFHGVIVGLLFGMEFACIYFGMLYTDAARSVVFVYLSPFVVAVGAHLFLKGDRLTFLKTLGLIIAFAGIVVVFQGRLLEITAAILWGATTLYIKRFMADKVEPIHTFLYQLVFSIPILFLVSLILEPVWIVRIDGSILAALFYQSVLIAFISYLFWFKLIHQYAVSRLSAFTFFTPVFGVLSGVLFLGEEFTGSLMVGLPMVSVGIFVVNWRKKTAF